MNACTLHINNTPLLEIINTPTSLTGNTSEVETLITSEMETLTTSEVETIMTPGVETLITLETISPPTVESVNILSLTPIDHWFQPLYLNYIAKTMKTNGDPFTVKSIEMVINVTCVTTWWKRTIHSPFILVFH